MSTKDFVSLICEYNPFHFGHYYQLSRLKEEFGAVVCIMSGNIVQRGSVAVADKYLRAKAAIASGADLVLELPIPWCCSSAKDFAAAGVHIANSIGGKVLAFGAEDDISVLEKIQNLFSTPNFHELLQNRVENNKNLSYPAAVTEIIRWQLGEEYAQAVGKPNNILGLEYLSAMKGRNMNAFVVKRNPEYKSSSSIRSLGKGDGMISELPEISKSVFKKELNKDFPRSIDKLDSFYIGTLRALALKDVQAEFYGVTKDLAQRLFRESFHYSTVESLVECCTDKIYTAARVRRAINSIVFGITSERVRRLPPYTCVLGLNEQGREILKSAKTLKKIQIVTKPVRAVEKGEEVKQAFLFAKSIEDIVGLSAPIPCPADLGRSPFVLK